MLNAKIKISMMILLKLSFTMLKLNFTMLKLSFMKLNVSFTMLKLLRYGGNKYNIAKRTRIT